MTDRTVRVFLESIVTGYQAGLAKASASTEAFSAQVKAMNATSKMSFSSIAASLGSMSAGTAGVAAAGVVAAGVLIKMGKAGVDSYVGLVDQVKAYKNATGASAEESSKMVAVANALGISTDTVAQGMFRLSRQVAAHSGALKEDGVVIERTKTGQVDLNKTLLSVAAAYQRAGAGAAGNQILFDAFGRSGLRMIPILKQSTATIEELWAAAEQHHQIVTDDDLAAVFKYKVATRELGEAWTGVERELGTKAVPILTAVDHGLTSATEGIDKVGRALTERTHTEGESFLSRVNKDLNQLQHNLTSTPSLLDMLTGAHKKAGDAAHQQAVDEQKLADQAKATAAAITAYGKALDALNAAAFGQDAAQDKVNTGLIDFADKIRAAQQGGDKFATSLDNSTATGIANRDMLRQIVEGIEAMAKTAVANGEDAAAATRPQRQALEEVMAQLGLNKDEAQRYLDVLNGMPADKTTKVSIETADAKAKLMELFSLLGGFDRQARNDVGKFGIPSPDVTFPDVTLPTDVSKAVGGHGPATDAVRKQQADAAKAAARSAGEAAKQAADAAKRAAEELKSYLEALFKQHMDIVAQQFKAGLVSSDAYLASLDEQMARLKPWTSEWVQLQEEKAAVFLDAQQAIRTAQDNEYATGAMSADKYLQLLQERLAGLKRYSADWRAVWDQINQIEQEAADKQRQIAEDASSSATSARDAAFSKLNGMLDTEKAIRKQMVDAAEEQRKKLAEIQAGFLADQRAALDDRRQQLAGWARIDEQAVVSWGNSASALSANVKAQTDAFGEWADGLDALRRSGLSDTVISMLGLDEGPQMLGQVRSLSTATQAELQDLNDAVAARAKLATDRVSAEQAQTYSKISLTLKGITDRYAAEVQQATQEFLATQLDLNTQLAQVGLDGGRSFGDAIAQGITSSIPAIRAAAEAARAAQQAATQAAQTSVNVNGSTRVNVPDGHGGVVTVNADQLAFFGAKPNPDGSWSVPVGSIPSHEDGIAYVPNTGLKNIHQGERVVSAMDNLKLVAAVQALAGGSAQPITVFPQIAVHVYDANGHLVTDDRLKVVVEETNTGTGWKRTVVGSRG